MQSTRTDKGLEKDEAAHADAGSQPGAGEELTSAQEDGAEALGPLEVPGPLEVIDAALDKDRFDRALLIFLEFFETLLSADEPGVLSSGYAVLLRARAAMILGSCGRARQAVQVWTEVARFWTATGQPARALAAILQLKSLPADLNDLLDEFSSLYHIQSPLVDLQAQPAAVKVPGGPVDLSRVEAAWAGLTDQSGPAGEQVEKLPRTVLEQLLDRAVDLLARAPVEVDRFNILPALPLLSLLPARTLREVLLWVEYEIFARGERVMQQGVRAEDLLWTVSDDFCVENPVAQPSAPDGEDDESSSGGAAQQLRLPSGTLLGLNAFGPRPKPAAYDVLSHQNGELLRLRGAAIKELDQKFGDFHNRLTTLRRHSLTELLLERHPFFTQIERDSRAALMGHFVGIRVASGENLVLAGQPSPGLYMVLDGDVEVLVERADGEGRVESLYSGDLFGAVSLVSDRAPAATYRMATPGHLLYLSAQDFSTIAQTLPGVARFAVQVANQRMQRVENARQDG